jgi:hypothetical protein
MRTIFAAALIAAATAAMADEVEPAQVQPSRPFCDEPAKAIKALKDTFGEEPRAIGLDTQDRLISLFVDPADGSWTLLMTVPGQSPISCVLVGGEAWEERPLPLVGDPS